MESIRAKLAASKPAIRFFAKSELSEGVKYDVFELKRMHTKYGISLVATISFGEEVGKVFLPQMYQREFTDADLQTFEKAAANGERLHIIRVGDKIKLQ